MRIKPFSSFSHAVNFFELAQLPHQKSFLVWFTGLPGSGKTTLVQVREKALVETGYNNYLLDGDKVRAGLNKDSTSAQGIGLKTCVGQERWQDSCWMQAWWLLLYLYLLSKKRVK